MQEYLFILKKSPLFSGIEENEAEQLLSCLGAKTAAYLKNQYIFRAGETTSSAGLVLSGSVHILKEDVWGNRGILAEAQTGDLFGETYAVLPKRPLEVSAFAAENTEILFLSMHKILTICSSACRFHTLLIQNLLSVLAQKNLMLTEKMEHLTKRSTREKLLSYLSAEAQRQQSSAFEIPYNRQQLADYLSVDRSAMSGELGKLRDEGLLRFHKNRFELKGRR